MPRETIGESASTLEMGCKFLDKPLTGVRAHYTIIRKPLDTTSGGLHQTIVGARKARQDEANSFSQTLGRKQEEAEQLKQDYLDSTEITLLRKGQKYMKHGLGGLSLTHGKNDGAHGSTLATFRELNQNK